MKDAIYQIATDPATRKQIIAQVQAKIDTALSDPEAGGKLAFEVTIVVLAPEGAMIGAAKGTKLVKIVVKTIDAGADSLKGTKLGARASRVGKWTKGRKGLDDALAAQMRSQNLGRQIRHTAPARGLKGRILNMVERAQFNAFGDRANALGLIQNPGRTGSWGRIVNGRYREIARIDVGEIGIPGWRGQTHIHLTGQRGHLPLTTRLPGE